MSSASNAKAITAGVIAVAFLIGGAVWFDQSRQPVATPDLAASAAVTVQEGASETAVVASDEAPTVGDEPSGIAAMAPAIDTFFRNPDETTIIAGRATPGQTIAIMLGGEELDRVVTEQDGTFGAVVFIAAADQPRRVRLIGDPDGDAIVSAESVIVPPSDAVAFASVPLSQNAPAIGASGDTGIAPDVDAASAGAVVASADISSAAAPDVDTASPTALPSDPGSAPNVSAPPTLIADADGVRVIQRADPGASKPELIDNIALDTITYDTKGEVILAGRAVTDGFVQVYLDNKPITTSRITADGDWSIDLPDVDTGVYTLRVDEIDDDGNVQSRIETPFKREERSAVAAIMAIDTSASGFDVAVRTVQPGATLWAIAEEQFGDGIMYVAVFEANRDQIRNPDLIYPGQVFRLPQASQ